MKGTRMSISLGEKLYRRLKKEKEMKPHMSLNAIIVEALLAQTEKRDGKAAGK